MKKTNSHEKKLNYKLLHIYQTNSPIFSSEKTIRHSNCTKQTEAFFNFALKLQEMLCMDKTFNQPEKADIQKQKIRALYLRCFKNSPEAESSFQYFLQDLIGGRSLDYNFAYGLKIYLLFKDKAQMSPLDKKLFQSRLEANILSYYYTISPEKKYIPETELAEKANAKLKERMIRYKIFNHS